METEYIGKQAAIDELCYVDEYNSRSIATIRAMKPADVRPVRRGRWIKVNGKTAINCSACYHCSWSRVFEDTVKQFNFCPNCGADMRGGDAE